MSGGISRRRLLRDAGVAAGAVAVGGAFAGDAAADATRVRKARVPSSHRGKRVAVLGGGMAGLAAAHELVERIDLAVLERILP